MTVANNTSNLVPITTRTSKERKSLGRKGGIASGRKRREFRKMSELLEKILNSKVLSRKYNYETEKYEDKKYGENTILENIIEDIVASLSGRYSLDKEIGFLKFYSSVLMKEAEIEARYHKNEEKK